MTDPPNYLDECVKIEPLALEEEFIRTPSDLSYWNEQYAAAFVAWKKSKLAREQIWNLLYRELGSDGSIVARPGSRGVTVADVEAATITDVRYLVSCTAEIVAEGEKVRLAGIMETLRTKRDMLISLGAHMRSTMQQGITLHTPEYIEQRELVSRP